MPSPRCDGSVDEAQGEPDRSDHDGSAEVPTYRRLVLWQWRVRVGVAAGLVVWLVMQDWSPAAVLLLGFASGIAAMLLASMLARVELRLRALKRRFR